MPRVFDAANVSPAVAETAAGGIRRRIAMIVTGRRAFGNTLISAAALAMIALLGGGCEETQYLCVPAQKSVTFTLGECGPGCNNTTIYFEWNEKVGNTWWEWPVEPWKVNPPYGFQTVSNRPWEFCRTVYFNQPGEYRLRFMCPTGYSDLVVCQYVTAIGMEVTPSAATVCANCGCSVQFSLTNNCTPHGVTWSVSPANGVTLTPDGESATVTPNGTATGVYTITATSVDNTNCLKTATLTVVKVDIVPDFNHDRKIDDADRARLSSNETYRFWINDDHETSDAGGDDWPGSSNPDYSDTQANGVRDLVDFFPVYLDVAQAVTVLPKASYSYIVKQADGALNGVPTTLKADSANEDYKPEAYQTRSGVAQSMASATLQQITSSGVTIPDTYLADAETTGEGFVMVFEGRSVTQNPLVLEIRRKSDNALIIKTEMPLRLSSVTDMYRTANLRSMTNPGVLSEPSNNPDSISNGKNLVFLHGYQPGTDANWPTAWLAETFKRFYWSGSQAKFHGVSWSSSGGSLGTAYQPAVTNAFCTAPALTDYVAGLNGDVTVVAHSLGNIVVSSAIVDHNMSVSKYMLCDAAVASEAYDMTMAQDDRLVNTWWTDYSNRTWAAKWHDRFAGTGDTRENLKWPDRFADIVNHNVALWNFYSTGDEVFDLTTAPSLLTGAFYIHWWFIIPTGYNWNPGRYSWQKQELFKGTEYAPALLDLGATMYAGWGFNSTTVGPNVDGQYEVQPVYSLNQANAATDQQLQTTPVFTAYPSWLVGTNALSQTQINDLLGMGIPALTPSTGKTTVDNFDANEIPQYNLNGASFKPNGWPTAGHSSPDASQWLHNDMKYVGYLYNYKLFDKVVDEGGLK